MPVESAADSGKGLFMKRIILMVLCLLYKVPGWFYKMCRMAGDKEHKKYNDMERYRFLQMITKRANRAGRIHIECFGHENLPENDGFVLFPNHQGLFDGLIFFETMERPFSIIMKKEVENLILVRQVREIIGAKLMDREDLRQSMTVIREVTKEVREGRNYIILRKEPAAAKAMRFLNLKARLLKAP